MLLSSDVWSVLELQKVQAIDGYERDFDYMGENFPFSPYVGPFDVYLLPF